MEGVFKPPPSLCFSGSNLAEEWRRWELQFKIYHVAAELDKKSGQTQVAILLHCAGAKAQKIFHTFDFANTDDDKPDNLNHVLKKSKSYCDPKKNVIFNRYKFWQRNQQNGESFD